MKIYHSLEEFSRLPKATVTIGTFDGVHKGHQKIISRVTDVAKQEHSEVVLLTFFPHPRMVLFPDDHGLQLLNTIEEKKRLLEKAGIQHLIIHPFSKKFSRMSSTEFVRDILVNTIGTNKLVIGYDHHFGRNREGSFNELQELAPVYNFEVEQIPEQDVNDVAVSSTKIREALLTGNIKVAGEFLGYDYVLTGTVVHGNKKGRELGFPTANLSVGEDYKLIPANGVYAVEVKLNDDGNVYKGALNIGNRPTFDNGARSIEVFILDFDKDVYGAALTIIFKERIRAEEKFSNADELIAAMRQDVEVVRQAL